MTDQVKEKMRLSTPLFGFRFKVTRFTSFLSWTGMIFCVLMMIGSLALLTIPTDVQRWVMFLRDQLFTEGGVLEHARDGTEIFDRVCYAIAYFMYAYGGVLLALALTFFPMYFLLRKRNLEKDQAGVMKMLKIICYTKAGIIIFFSFLGICAYTFNMTHGIGITGPIGLVLITFASLKIHGIRTQNPRYVKAFIIFKYVLLTLFSTLVIGICIYGSAILSQFWIFLLGVVVIMWVSFLWIFYTGFSITIHTIMENNLKGNYKTFDNNSFEDTVYKA